MGTGYISYHDYSFNANTDCGILIPKFNEFNTYITNLNNADLKELSINQIKAVNLSLRKINKNFNTVYINSEKANTSKYSFDSPTKTLKINLDNIAPSSMVTSVFIAEI